MTGVLTRLFRSEAKNPEE